jgi:hypothetical protein
VSAVPDEPDTALRDAFAKRLYEPLRGEWEEDAANLALWLADELLALPELVQLRKEAEIGRRVLAPTATYGHAAARPVDDGNAR